MVDQPATATPEVSDHEVDGMRRTGIPTQATSTPSAPARAVRSKGIGPGLTAIITWLIATPIAFFLPKLDFQTGPGGVRSLGLPLAGGLTAAGLIYLLSRRTTAGWLAGVSAGGFAAWAVMSLSTAMRGTPFPFLGLLGDAGRLTAMATRYSATAASSDWIIPGLPSEYPPLFPWVVGRTSALIDVPAWRLVGDFEILFTGLAILAGFLLWLRLFSPWLALAVTVLEFMSFPIPSKSYELLALMLFIPWVLLTLMNPPRGRLHWALSGLVLGFVIMTYYGWLVFAFFGMLAIVFGTWRKAADRRELVFYFLKVGAVAFLVASWFIVPLLYAKFTIGGSTVGDLYGSSNYLDLIFPFMQVTTPGVTGVLAMIQLIGLIGMIWLRGKTWWAGPLLALFVGAYVFRAVGAISFLLTQHTLLSQYTPSIYTGVSMIAAAPTLVYAVPRLLKRLSLTAPEGSAGLALAVFVAWCGYTFCIDWAPTPLFGGRYTNYTEAAYREPYPDGRYAQGITNPTPWFPVTPVQQAVEGVLGPNADPVVLSADERLFSYLPWHGYLGNDLGSSLTHTFERLDDIEKLAAVSDSAAFAQRSANLTYGHIDVFVLRKSGPDTWQWTFHRGFNQVDEVVSFSRAQFAPTDWVIVDSLPNDVVVAIRR